MTRFSVVYTLDEARVMTWKLRCLLGMRGGGDRGARKRTAAESIGGIDATVFPQADLYRVRIGGCAASWLRR
jgi:hypothetical protein